jgi:hypothetical protein
VTYDGYFFKYQSFFSYNAGKASILKAQKIAVERGLDPASWEVVRAMLWEVNGEACRKTLQYVEKINFIRESLK